MPVVPVGPADRSAADPPAADVARAAGRGVTTLAVLAAVGNGLSLVSSLVLARSVAPALYGAFALGATAVGFARVLGDCGAGSALVQDSAPLQRTALGQALALQLATAGAAAAALVGLAPVLRHAFAAPAQATWIIAVLALALVAEAPATVPRTRLRRAQQYRRLQLLTFVPLVGIYVVQIGGLLLGFGITALVAAQVAGAVLTPLSLAVGGGGLVRPVLRGCGALARRGLAYQGTLVVEAAYSLSALALVAGLLDTAQLGLWTWSTVLATPLISLVQNLKDLAFPALSRLQEHAPGRHDEAVELVARLQALLASVAVGVLVGLAVPTVRLVFAARWLPATGAARASLLGVVPLVLSSLLAAALDSRGRPDLRLRAMALSSAGGLLAIGVLARPYGPTGAAMGGYLVVPVLDFLVLLLWTGARMRRAVTDAAFVTVAAAAPGLALAGSADDLAGLALRALLAGLAGLAAVALVDRRPLRQAAAVLRRG